MSGTNENPTPAPSVALTTEPKPMANPLVGIWETEQNFALAQRAANALAMSELVPKAYQKNAPNCLIAIDISRHLGISPLMVMQNLHIIHGRPSWSSPFIIGAINSGRRFSPLMFEIVKLGKRVIEYTEWTGQPGSRRPKAAKIEVEDMSCLAYATDLKSGQRIDGPKVTIEMAVREGWYHKNESKWQTIPDLMIRYRSAAFFGRIYAPEILMGFQTIEETIDIVGKPTITATAKTAGASALQAAIDQTAGDATVADAVKAAAVDESIEPPPEPSRFCLKAMEKKERGETLTTEEAESVRDYELDLADYNARTSGGSK